MPVQKIWCVSFAQISWMSNGWAGAAQYIDYGFCNQFKIYLSNTLTLHPDTKAVDAVKYIFSKKQKCPNWNICHSYHCVGPQFIWWTDQSSRIIPFKTMILQFSQSYRLWYHSQNHKLHFGLDLLNIWKGGSRESLKKIWIFGNFSIFYFGDLSKTYWIRKWKWHLSVDKK